MFDKLVSDFSDMAGDITQGSICGAMGAGAGAVSGVALTGAGFGFSAPAAIGAGMGIGLVVYKGCKNLGIDDEIKSMLGK